MQATGTLCDPVAHLANGRRAPVLNGSGCGAPAASFRISFANLLQSAYTRSFGTIWAVAYAPAPDYDAAKAIRQAWSSKEERTGMTLPRQSSLSVCGFAMSAE
jgi:hypothetical protein